MSAFLTIIIVHFLGVSSPGPDFAIITRNSLCYSRKTGIITAAGIACGLMIHCLYSVAGIGLIISKSILLFNLVKYAGAAYLIYLGWKALRSKPPQKKDETLNKKKDLKPKEAFKNGFLCNVLNPKATLFIFAVFTQVIDPATSALTQLFYGSYMSIATFVWFSFVASVFSWSVISNLFRKTQTIAERLMGIVLIGLGLKVALTGNK